MIKLNRRLLEELLIIVGVIGLVLIFQPLINTLYTAGWALLMISTFSYIIFTLVPRNLGGKQLVKNYFRTLLVVSLIVILFILLSISLIPVLIR